MDSCTLCDLDLDHCHAPVLLHDDGSGTCTDGCGRALAAHDEVLACAELGPPGCCSPAHTEEVYVTPARRAA